MTTDMQPGQDLTGPGQTAVSVLAGNAVDWVSTAPGKDFKPLHFEPNGWSELMRLEPGTVVPRHRHSGDAHVYTISGQRRLLDTGAIIKAGDFVFEPAGA
ncbi:MAG TPA: cupin domain-containing protein, partial [Acidimicrobiales bacterium]|nr:cupin domain-containing protein [Acidimicrobiales bacterium]